MKVYFKNEKKPIRTEVQVWFIWNGILAANIHSGRSSYRRGTTLKELKVLPEPAKEYKGRWQTSHCGVCEELYLLVHDVMQSVKSKWAFRRIMSNPSSGSKNKQIKKAPGSRQ
jgi:hypothetical protein